jgi:quercetin dioxygenase-like cupin family protein
LNPARGDQSPQAGTIWGDRKGTKATRFLAKFVDGFSSPPHIHNVTYRAVVIKGLVHNDDPKAENMWMKPGSFWTQPAGEAHITAANGKKNVAYIEINSGPYLVQSPEKAFDNGERPVNIDQSNIVWLSASDVVRVGKSNVKTAYLWGDTTEGKSHGSMLKLPASFKGKIKTNANIFKAIVIEGALSYTNKKGTKELESGSYFGSTGDVDHRVSLKEGQETTLYSRSNGKYEILSD